MTSPVAAAADSAKTRGHGDAPASQAAGVTERVRDPVCGMTVDPHATAHRHRHGGRTYYFCSAGCLRKFAADPERYLSPSETKPAEPAPAGAIYTYPMHPEIRQVGPGSCPICG